jgi:hypothetical protein
MSSQGKKKKSSDDLDAMLANSEGDPDIEETRGLNEAPSNEAFRED